MDPFLERINEWGYALGEILKAQLETKSLTVVGVVFAAGLLTSLTPCVYPMIPVTVTYIGGAAEGNRRRAVGLSLIYVFGLAAVYALLGVVGSMLGKTFGQFTRSPWIYGSVGMLFILFGLAMLDLFTVPVPRVFTGVQAQGARRGGYFGALLMGVAAGFVALPCAAPVLGALLTYVATTRDVLWGGSLLFVFALGLGLLLMLLGIFSGLLSSLPRAGAWMVWIKKAFGVGLAATGAWFLFLTARMVFGGAAS